MNPVSVEFVMFEKKSLLNLSFNLLLTKVGGDHGSYIWAYGCLATNVPRCQKDGNKA